MSGTWSSTNYGYITLTNKTNSARKLEFPAVGLRNTSNGSLTNNGTSGYYWSSVQSSSTSANNMRFNSSSVNPINDNNKLYGFNLRCVRQK